MALSPIIMILHWLEGFILIGTIITRQTEKKQKSARRHEARPHQQSLSYALTISSLT
jgi:hypothetical protein